MKARADGALVAASATIAVCTQPANTSTQPCSPLATLYTDATLATPCTGTLKDGTVAGATNCSNPLITDIHGNYHFYGSSGPYTIQIYGSGLTTSVESDIVIPGILAPNTSTSSFNSVLWVGGTAGYTSIANCLAALPASGGTCAVIPNYSEALAGNVTLLKNQCIAFHGPATITMGTNTISAAHGADGLCIVGTSAWGNDGNSTGVQFIYTGTGTAISIGDSVANTFNVYLSGFVIKISAANAKALALNSVQNSQVSRVRISGNSSAGQVGLALDGSLNYVGDNLFDGLQWGGLATGINMANNSNFNTFLNLRGEAAPAAATGINIASGNGNIIVADLEAFSGGGSAVTLANTNNNFGNRISIYGQGNTTDFTCGATSTGNILDNIGATNAAQIITSGCVANNVVVNPYKMAVSGGSGITAGLEIANAMPQIQTATFGAMAFDSSANTRVRSNAVLGWSSAGADPSAGANDTGFSRISAGVLALGNGTANDTSGALQLNSISKYGGVATVAGGVPALVAKVDATAQAADIGTTLLYAVPASGAGMYRVSCAIVLTQAATSSSTLPACNVAWTDNDSGVVEAAHTFTQTNTANTLGATNGTPLSGGAMINAKASTNINYATTGYASSGVTVMQFAVHFKLEYLGN